MPHKHKRDKSKNDDSLYDLPPSKTAHPLPAMKSTTATRKSAAKPAKRKNAQLQYDDTPRALTRLLSGDYRPPRSGLDDGPRPSKKVRKESKPEELVLPAAAAVPTIRPREALSSFAARVDAALPFSGVSKKSGGAKELGRERQTRTERKMQKMQKEWREEDRRRKEKLRAEEAEGDAMDELFTSASKWENKDGKKKGRQSGHHGNIDEDDDPWAHLAAKRLEARDAKTAAGSGAGLVGLHDVVLAPPRFSRARQGKENLGMNKGGGLKRQHELLETRMSVVEGYRQMMREKRGEEG